jgi:hypothetical protein
LSLRSWKCRSSACRTVAAAEVAQQPQQVGFAHLGEKTCERRRLVRELGLEPCQVDVEGRRHVEARAVGEVEDVDRVHLHPFGLDPQLHQQLAGQRLGVAEQRIEMGRGVEGVAAAPEGAAIAARHVVLLDQQHPRAVPRQQVAGDQSADPRTDHHHVVGGVRRPPQAAEQSLHSAAPSAGAF